MHTAGQNLVGGHEVDYYTAIGTLLGSVLFTANVPNGDSQRTILIGDTATAGNPDLVYDQLDDALFRGTTTGGAVCFADASPPDCVSWGNFTGAGALPGPTGLPEAPGGIPAGSSISRSIARGCATLLEPGDDTDDSSVDFSVTSPTPRNNTVTPTETACTGGGNDNDAPQTTITKEPSNRLEKPAAVYKFRSDEPGSTFECKIDKKPFKSCTSPKRLKRLDEGSHSFKVRAIDEAGNVDKSADTDRFKVVED